MKRSLLVIAVFMGLCLLLWPFSAGAKGYEWDCDSLFCELSNGTLAFTGYGRMMNFTDPREPYDYPPPWYDYRNGIKAATFQTGITSVGDYAFFQCTKLESVSLPDSVDLIGAHAFEECTNLSLINIPSQVESIQEYAFAECKALTSFTIPDGVTTIDTCTFYKCTGLESITIPASVTAIEDHAFTDCGLTYVDFEGTQDQWAGIRKDLGKNAPLATAVIHCTDTPEPCSHSTTRTVREHEVAATCTAEGSYEEVVYCVDCEEEIFRETVVTSRLGHDLEHHDAKAATCTEIGWDAYDKCSRCDYSTYVEIPALSHDLEHHDAKAPTCTSIGWEAYETCKRCDYTTYEELPALGHDPEEHAAKSPTCTEIGWNAYETCKRCDYTTYEELPALGHDFVHHGAQCVTCTEIGWDAYDTCSRCDYTTYEEISALGHNLVHHEAKTVTCMEVGWDAYDTCSRCNYTTRVVQPALGHDLEHHDAKAPTCTAIGWKAYDTCRRCDYTTYEKLPALDHDPEWHEAKPPTCTEVGWKAYCTCKRCDYSSYAELPALGHQIGYHAAKAPTCTEEGYEEYWQCSACSALFGDQDGRHGMDEVQTIPAVGHTAVADAAKAANCREPGLTEGSHCAVCNAVLVQQSVVPPDPGAHIPASPARENQVDPGCAEEGSYDEVIYCAVCGDELAKTHVIVPPAHDFGDPVFEWSEDGRSCTAVQICSRNAEHKKSSSCEITATVTKSPTEDEAGSIMRIPLFENKLCESGAITEEIPALKDMDVLKLPAGLETIEEGAFAGILCEAVIIPDGCREIQAGAFADCGNLRYVRIPDAVIVSDTAFPDRDDLILDRSRQDP